MLVLSQGGYKLQLLLLLFTQLRYPRARGTIVKLSLVSITFNKRLVRNYDSRQQEAEIASIFIYPVSSHRLLIGFCYCTAVAAHFPKFPPEVKTAFVVI